MRNKSQLNVNTKDVSKHKSFGRQRKQSKITRRDSFQHISEIVYNETTGQYQVQKMHVVRSPVRSNYNSVIDKPSLVDDTSKLLPSLNNNISNRRNNDQNKNKKTSDTGLKKMKYNR